MQPQPIDHLLEQLDSEQAEIRKQAQDQLLAIGAEVVEPLLKILPGAASRPQVCIITVLGGLGDYTVIDSLCNLLESPNLMVRVSVAKALGNFQSPQVIQALRQHLGDPSEMVRMWIIQSLGKLKAMEALPELIDLLQTTTSNTTRYMLLRALGDYGQANLTHYILPYQDHEDRHVRDDARAALLKLSFSADV